MKAKIIILIIIYYINSSIIPSNIHLVEEVIIYCSNKQQQQEQNTFLKLKNFRAFGYSRFLHAAQNFADRALHKTFRLKAEWDTTFFEHSG